MQIESTMTPHPFKPIIFPDSKTLILGYFPTSQEISSGFYHTAKNDKFWQLLSLATSYPINNNDQKIWLLKESKLALWDILSHHNTIKGDDFTPADELVNDISLLTEKHPSISKVALTTKRVQTVYNEHFKHLLLEQILLPSPLSSYHSISSEQKAQAFKQIV